MTTRRSITLENFLQLGRAVTSPRSLELCMARGVDPAELLPSSADAFRGMAINSASAQRLLERSDKRRLKLVAELQREYSELPPLSNSRGVSPNATDGAASSQQRRRSTSPVSQGGATTAARSEAHRSLISAIAERQERDRQLLAARIAEGLQAAQERKEQQLGSEQRRRHHHDVAARLEFMKEADEQALQDKQEKLSLRQLRREAARAGAASSRSWAPVERNLELKRRTEAVLQRQQEILAAEQRRHLAQWEADLRRSDFVAERREAEVQKRKETALAIEKRVQTNNAELAAVRLEMAALKERQRRERVAALEARRENQRAARTNEMLLQEHKRLEALNRRDELSAVETELKLEAARVNAVAHQERLRVLESERLLRKEEELDRRLEREEAARRQRRALEYLKQRQLISKLAAKQ
jgi:hypothetical protein